MAEQKEQSSSVAELSRANNNYNALQIRLDTKELLRKIELYLKSEIETIKQYANGEFEMVNKRIGQPLADPEGISRILNWISLAINSQVVQGNFPVDAHGFSAMYEMYIYNFRINIMEFIMRNMYNWEMYEDEIEGLVDAIMILVEPFISRLIGNKERESYSETIRTVESNVMTAKNSIPLFNSSGQK